jgi:integrase
MYLNHICCVGECSPNFKTKEPHEMASVYRKAGASGKLSPYWQAKFSGPDGKPVSKTTELTDRKAALALAREWEKAAASARQGMLSQAASMQLLDKWMQMTTGERFNVPTVEKYCQDWLESKKNVGKTSANTLVRYEPVLERFVESLPAIRRRLPMSCVTPIDIDRFLHAEKRGGRSNTTSNFSVRLLRGVFSTARRKGVIMTNPAEAVDLFPEHEADQRVPFTADQVRALLSVADTEWTGLILFGYQAGLRLSDAAHLTWNNIDLEQRLLSFQPQKTKRSRKTMVRRFHPEIQEYLASLPRPISSSAPIFPTLCKKTTGSACGLSNQFAKLVVRAGIESPRGAEKHGPAGRRTRTLCFHSLRHSFNSRLANADVGIDTRKVMVGHASNAMNERYTHLEVEMQDKALEKLSRAA